MNDIFQSKDMSELKDFPKKTMPIGATCQSITLVRHTLVLFYRRAELPLISVKLTKS